MSLIAGFHDGSSQVIEAMAAVRATEEKELLNVGAVINRSDGRRVLRSCGWRCAARRWLNPAELEGVLYSSGAICACICGLVDTGGFGRLRLRETRFQVQVAACGLRVDAGI